MKNTTNLYFKCLLANLVITSLLLNQAAHAQLPAITSISPAVANPGAAVTITGSNFNTTAANNIIYFGATKAAATSASATSLNVTVPSGATFMPVTVTNTASALTGYSQYPFVPTFDNSSFSSGIHYDAQVDFTAGIYPTGVEISDLDGDGKPDIATANFVDSSISILRNVSTAGSITLGSFATHVDFPAHAYPSGLAIGDIDRDGKPDIAITNAARSISIYRNTGTPGTINSSSLAPYVDLVADSAASFVKIFDIDRDGKPDIITLSMANKLSVYRNIGTSGSISTGSFAARITYTTPTQPNNIEFADIDGDGKPDMVVGCSSFVYIYKNNSSPGVLIFSRTDLPVYSSHNVAVGDINNDGKPDIAVGCGGFLRMLQNNCTPGTITTASFGTAVAVPMPGGLSVTLGDLNGDGKLDAVVPAYFSSTIALYRNTGFATIDTSSFTPFFQLPHGISPRELRIADLDGDGKPELIVTGAPIASATTPVTVYKNSPLPAGIETTETGKRLVIRSNPSSGSIIIDASSPGAISLCTMDGTEITRQNTRKGSVTLTFPAGMPNGVYLCRFVSEYGKEETERIILER